MKGKSDCHTNLFCWPFRMPNEICILSAQVRRSSSIDTHFNHYTIPLLWDLCFWLYVTWWLKCEQNIVERCLLYFLQIFNPFVASIQDKYTFWLKRSYLLRWLSWITVLENKEINFFEIRVMIKFRFQGVIFHLPKCLYIPVSVQTIKGFILNFLTPGWSICDSMIEQFCSGRDSHCCL